MRRGRMFWGALVVCAIASCGGSTAPNRVTDANSKATTNASATIGSGHIDVHVTNIPSLEGAVLVVLYDQATYLKEGASVAKASAKVVSNEMHVTLERVASGRYLVVVTHDENDNGTLDTSVIGLPTEAYGFSRNARGTFGPPSFDDAAFDFDGSSAAIDVELR